MRKNVAAIFVFLSVFLVACSSSFPANMASSASVKEKYVATEPGFIVPEYSQFNSPTSENGLEGTKIAFMGELSKQGVKNNAYYYIVSTSEGNWVVLVGDTDLLEYSKIIDIVKTGSEVEVYAEYLGFSDVFELPSCAVITDGYFIRESGSDEKMNVAWDTIVLNNLLEQMSSSSSVSAVGAVSEVESTVNTSTATVSQEQAIRKAKDYLAYSAFSASGLVAQLEYEGFSNEDATYAVDNITVDWNEQAAQKAKDYLDYSAFSRQGLIDQLVYEGFTQEQAVYGADSVGL